MVVSIFLFFIQNCSDTAFLPRGVSREIAYAKTSASVRYAGSASQMVGCSAIMPFAKESGRGVGSGCGAFVTGGGAATAFEGAVWRVDADTLLDLFRESCSEPRSGGLGTGLATHDGACEAFGGGVRFSMVGVACV